jgi:hypothetical protein
VHKRFDFDAVSTLSHLNASGIHFEIRELLYRKEFTELTIEERIGPVVATAYSVFAVVAGCDS